MSDLSTDDVEAANAGLHTKRSAAYAALLKCTNTRLLDVVADTELLDERTVLEDVVLLDVGQKTTTATNEHKQAATGVEVLLVGLHVLGELTDTLAQDGDLNLGVAGVHGGIAELCGKLRLALLGNSHVSPFVHDPTGLNSPQTGKPPV